MTIALPTMCEACRHFKRFTKTCAAYPDGIPSELYPFGVWDHRTPLDGDNGIRFEPIEDAEFVDFVLEWFDEEKEYLDRQSGMPDI